MTDNSANLNLPYIQQSQAQKHVTHNEAIRKLDSLVQLSVITADQTTPPGAPEDGDRYLLPAGVTGVWAGHTTELATYEDNLWIFYPPRKGWLAWVEDQDLHFSFNGTDWVTTGGSGAYQNLDFVGIQATADTTNRLTVAAEATLLTHGGAGHQVKINKAADTDTASLLFQTNWSGRAEMGTTGDDDFHIKVSDDGSTYHESMVADGATGKVSFPSGVEGLVPTEFGDAPLVNTAYIASQRPGLVTNATGLLGSSYNYPASFAFDASSSPDLPASFRFEGYYGGKVLMDEPIPIDPNLVYRLESYLKQESQPGDFSAFTNEEKHRQYMGLAFFDADELEIQNKHHMRHRHGGTDSLTTLAAPLTPGDTTVQVVDTSGWNETDSNVDERGLIIFGYQGSNGRRHDFYSRLVEYGLFDVGQVNKTTHVVTLNQALPASLGNPDDPNGTWPAGTPLANCSSTGALRYTFYTVLYVPELDKWYRTANHIGGVDRSGTNDKENFPPGTSYVRPFWLPNFTNRSGGYAGHPDTGAGHSVWFTGVSVRRETLSAQERVLSGSTSGKIDIRVPSTNFATGSVSLINPNQEITET